MYVTASDQKAKTQMKVSSVHWLVQGIKVSALSRQPHCNWMDSTRRHLHTYYVPWERQSQQLRIWKARWKGPLHHQRSSSSRKEITDEHSTNHRLQEVPWRKTAGGWEREHREASSRSDLGFETNRSIGDKDGETWRTDWKYVLEVDPHNSPLAWTWTMTKGSIKDDS